MYYLYGICEKCGRTVSKETMTGTGEDTVDSKSYRRVKSKDCGCDKSIKRVDIIGS